ncbi:tail protein [uncultured phage_MedDCM-OCT-S45-C18]|uniref:Putative tail tubular protein B n=1 Tax=uncultured phage_MedDCM-OCT-S45-C18 TaxID=2741072 RepID=A0A6S4PAM0_9CAUD|nr:tail protein [uncultured phage_MedDCM-OCT-S45-C18]BAQ94250.1 putative tail tubular protein B [uncultured phage_MedDCM-OCT-S45-C18]
MANITTTVPNLIQGVSQQSPQVRLAGQCEEQINGLSTVTKGLTKRPPARLIDNLGAVALEGDFLHFINRSETERYVVTVEHRTTGDGTGVIRVFNLETGDEASITAGEVTYNNGYQVSGDYLKLATANKSHEQLKALTIGDSTFLLNTDVTVAKTAEKSEALDSSRALVFVKQGDFSKKYGLKFRDKGTFSGGGAKFQVTWVRESGGVFSIKYAYKIQSVTLISGGAGYNVNDEPTLEFPSDVDWDVRPEFNITVDSSGVVTGITLLHPGLTVEYDSAQTFSTNVDASPAFDEVNITSLSSSQAQGADTQVIATGLLRALTGVDGVNSTPKYAASQSPAHNASDLPIRDAYTSKDKDGSILINRNDGQDFFLEAFDGLAGSGLGLVHKEVDSLSDLPVRGPDGFRVAVRGSADANEDDYYLRFETNDGQSFGEGGWVEDVGADLDIALDPSTLPLQLVNTGVNTFTINTTQWAKRKAGDDETNPFPSFVGKKLNNFVFFKNRLGFIYEDSVVLSEAGELFNFFRTTVRTLLDTAPIDVTSATANVTNLRSSVAFQENLLLFADRGQFVLKGDPLTNETITLEAVTNYDVNTSEDPLAVGSYVYFPFKRGNFLGMQEYSLNATTDVYDSDDITTQVPGYITDGNILVTSGSSATDLIALSSGGDTIYVYKYFFNGREKVVSSWSKFKMPFNVLSLEFINSSLFVVGDKDGDTLLTEMKCEELRLEDDTLDGFTIHLDMLKKKDDFVGNPTTTPTDTLIDLGFTPGPDDVVEVYDSHGNRVVVNFVNGNQASIQSYNRTCFSGLRYNLEYTFSEPVFKQGNPPVSSGLARMILRNGTLFFTDALDFQVEVTPIARDKRIFTYSPNVINITSTDTLLSQDGKLRFSIFTQAKDSLIKIVNSSAFASNFQACEFEANVHTRSTRI